MYYGYNNNKQIIMADSEFIELLGYKVFDDILKNSISQSIKFEDGKIYLNQQYKSIKANYTEIEFYTANETIKLVKLSNIIETKNSLSTLQLNYHPIYLNVHQISNEIGLSIDDYKLYLDSFIDQSIIDEKKLLNGDHKAIKNLSNLALTLKIPKINILLLKIKKLPQAERADYIDEYYTKLALLTLKEPTDNIIEKDTPTSKTKEEELNSTFTELILNIDAKEKQKSKALEVEPIELVQTLEIKEEKKSNPITLDMDLDLNLNLDEELPLLKEVEIEPLTIAPIENSAGVAKLSLENVPALPIDYNPKIAADELNLPVVLIEEFVEDFIEQARHDKDHILASYYQKDMDNIHELGHKLKGAASNLRINELADVLEEIQFCTEHSKLESLFIKYWGLFISLEEYMKQPKQL